MSGLRLLIQASKSSKWLCVRSTCIHKNFSSFRWVPEKPVWTTTKESDLPPPTIIDTKTARLLENLALVDFRTEEAIVVLQDAIRWVDELRVVNTDGVEPMTSVLESTSLTLRSDEVTEGGLEQAERLLANCEITQEGYWVAPCGNKPRDQTDDKHIFNEIKKNVS